MRKISPKPIAVFFALFVPSCLAALWLAHGVVHLVPLQDYTAIVMVVLSVILIYALNMAALGGFLWLMPLTEGTYVEGSREDFVYNVYMLFYLVLFNSLIFPKMIPVPMMRQVYRGLGARMGENSYAAGAILDPPMVEMGRDSLIGYSAVLCAHAVEGAQVSFARIIIGDRVTVGMRAIVMPGVRIENDAIVAAGALITKGTHIRSGEIWAGVPARCIKTSATPEERSAHVTAAYGTFKA